MEKVKITQEQAEAIRSWVDKTQLFKAKIVGLLGHGEDESIAEMDTETLAKALYIGYEVEPEFKVGEKIVDESDDNKTIITIKGEAYGKLYGYWTDHEANTHVGTTVRKVNARHATDSEIAAEKERRMWKELNREFRIFKKGDIAINLSQGSELHRPPFEIDRDLKTPKDHLRLVCPAENRLDIKHD